MFCVCNCMKNKNKYIYFFFYRLEAIAMDAELQEKQMTDLKKLGEMIKNGCENAIKEQESKKESKEDDEPGKEFE